MKIHTEIVKDDKDERTYQVEVVVPKTDQPIVPGEVTNRDTTEALEFFETQIMEHDWVEEMGEEEKIEVLRQYSLYWFLKHVLQAEYYPLPKTTQEKPN